MYGAVYLLSFIPPFKEIRIAGKFSPHFYLHSTAKSQDSLSQGHLVNLMAEWGFELWSPRFYPSALTTAPHFHLFCV